MESAASPSEGRCRCGDLRFEIAAPPLLTLACHCRGCQQMTASAFSLSATVANEAFRLVEGDPVPGGQAGRDGPHRFCGRCLSWCFTQPPGAGFVNVRSTLLQEARWSRPYVDLYTSEALAWAATPAVHRFERFPSWPRFEALVEDFAAVRADWRSAA